MSVVGSYLQTIKPELDITLVQDFKPECLAGIGHKAKALVSPLIYLFWKSSAPLQSIYIALWHKLKTETSDANFNPTSDFLGFCRTQNTGAIPG